VSKKILVFVIISFLFGVITSAGTGYYVFIKPSQNTIRDYQAKQRILTDANIALGKSVADRDADVSRLEGITSSLRSEADRARADYRILENANRIRQGIIATARGSLESTDDAIRKLELIIDAFEQMERN
jgi:Na+-transporting NADH:ubiquinone oxidoreductase subunit NqrC